MPVANISANAAEQPRLGAAQSLPDRLPDQSHAKEAQIHDEHGARRQARGQAGGRPR